MNIFGNRIPHLKKAAQRMLFSELGAVLLAAVALTFGCTNAGQKMQSPLIQRNTLTNPNPRFLTFGKFLGIIFL